ncbi:MAG: RHS repeat-associated core domain-containing protein [Phycisphaerales bacterium]|nr:RHS repeat-associated core domain-containing protein [Phycisphaerales bacterium]
MVRAVDPEKSGAMLTGGTTTNGGPFYYTSFGERVYYDSGSSSWKLGGEFPIGSPRYLYDGGHGYETGLLALAGANTSLAPITFQHVGERWYQPEIGRFVQRDPIGLGGGSNCYVYVRNNPAMHVDPAGLCGDIFADIDNWLNWAINGPPVGAAGSLAGAGSAANHKWKLGIGRPVNLITVVCAGAWFGWNAGKGVIWVVDELFDDVPLTPPPPPHDWASDPNGNDMSNANDNSSSGYDNSNVNDGRNGNYFCIGVWLQP